MCPHAYIMKIEDLKTIEVKHHILWTVYRNGYWSGFSGKNDAELVYKILWDYVSDYHHEVSGKPCLEKHVCIFDGEYLRTLSGHKFEILNETTELTKFLDKFKSTDKNSKSYESLRQTVLKKYGLRNYKLRSKLKQILLLPFILCRCVYCYEVVE